MHKRFIFLSLLLLAGCAGMTTPAQIDSSPASVATQGQIAELRQAQADIAGEVQRLRDNLLLAVARIGDQEEILQEIRTLLLAEKVTPGGEKAGEMQAIAVETPKDVYMRAFADFAIGSYAQAITGFDAFLRGYADNDYAGHAMYWLGECYFAQEQYPAAIIAFQNAAERYPQSAKAPDALLKLAAALRRVNREEQAAEVLAHLRKAYPESAAVRKIEVRQPSPFTKETQ